MKDSTQNITAFYFTNFYFIYYTVFTIIVLLNYYSKCFYILTQTLRKYQLSQKITFKPLELDLKKWKPKFLAEVADKRFYVYIIQYLSLIFVT